MLLTIWPVNFEVRFANWTAEWFTLIINYNVCQKCKSVGPLGLLGLLYHQGPGGVLPGRESVIAEVNAHLDAYVIFNDTSLDTRIKYVY